MDTDASASFDYGDRLITDCFRLLKIEAQPSNEGQITISCWLETHLRADAPRYATLSYAWYEPLSESADTERLIRLNGHYIEVTANLYQVLRHIVEHGIKEDLEEEAVEYWWIDALCINQADSLEQTQQVRIMHSIYRQAQMVVVWLGADFKQEAPIVREFLRALLGKYLDVDRHAESNKLYRDGFLGNNNESLLAAGLPSLDAPVWKSVVSFWDRAWFYRSWVAQEVALSTEFRFFCGSTRFLLLELVEASRFFVFSGLDETLMLVRTEKWHKSVTGRRVGNSAVAIEENWYFVNDANMPEPPDFTLCANRFTGEPRDTNHPLLRLFAVYMFGVRRREASDGRDKIFALLVYIKQVAQLRGLSEIDLKIDYSKSLTEVYHQAVTWIVMESRCLGILSILSPDRNLEERLGNCSWIPDLRESPPNPLRVFLSPLEGRLVPLSSSPDRIPQIKDYELLVSGKLIGSVAAVGDTYHSMVDDGCLELSARVLIGCPLTMPKHNHLSQLEVWRRTLTTQSAYENEPDPAQSRSDFHNWLAFFILREMHHAFLEGRVKRMREVLARMPSFDILANLHSSEPRMLPTWGFWQNISMNPGIYNSILNNPPKVVKLEILGRRLFRMSGSWGVYLGYGPEIMEEDDEVWFVATAALPLVLRKGADHTYAVVGEAYFIDANRMFDEVADVEWQRLTLR